MSKLRIGNDVTAIITITASGSSVAWDLSKIAFVLAHSDAQNKDTKMTFSVDENDNTKLVAKFAAEDQRFLGTYRVIVVFTDAQATCTWDAPSFELVEFTADADVTTTIAVNLTGTVELMSISDLYATLQSAVISAQSDATSAQTSATAAANSATAAAAEVAKLNDPDAEFSLTSENSLQNKIVTKRFDNDEAAVTAHVGDTTNPHGVTKAQVGLGAVDNTADSDKPVSEATRTAIAAEKTGREDADAALQVNINSETDKRVSANSALAGAIDAEETARKDADNLLQANIDTEVADRATADGLNEKVANKVTGISEDSTDTQYPSALGVVTPMTSNERVLAKTINSLLERVDSLEAMLRDGVGCLTVDTLQVNRGINQSDSVGSAVIRGSAAPTVIPDFVGQLWVYGTTIYMAVATDSVSNWKQL